MYTDNFARNSTTLRDTDRDGDWDVEEVWRYTFRDDGLIDTFVKEVGAPGGMKIPTEVVQHIYDPATGVMVAKAATHDYNADGLIDLTTLRTWTFDERGSYATETLTLPDRDGDGAPDYQEITTYTRNDIGQVLSKMTVRLTYGEQAPGDYCNETWTYATDGQVASYSIDDPINYDCVITQRYVYKHGLLQSIREKNEVRFGDTRERIVESFHDTNKDGLPDRITEWAARDEAGNLWHRIDHDYTRSPGYEAVKTSYDATGDGTAEKVVWSENWFNAAAQSTQTLISHDVEGGGVIDRQDITWRTFGYHGEMISETTDYGRDGIVEYSWYSDPLIA